MKTETRTSLFGSSSVLLTSIWTAVILFPPLRALSDEPNAIEIGKEVSVAEHLDDGQEFDVPLSKLLDHGRLLLMANWTPQEGGGRPLTKGTGKPLADPTAPLVFPRNFNRVSAPDANSCAGCHNAPFGIPGGGGDFVTSVFVLGQRFDFVTFDRSDLVPTRGAVDEEGEFPTLQTIANQRATLGMFGSGYIEMLARQMTAELQATRDRTGLGESNRLVAKGISFGKISRTAEGAWDVSQVEGLSAGSVATAGPDSPPSLIIRPFHQAGAVVSLREFTVNAFNHHHGIQATERFGTDADPDGDGFVNEMSRAEVSAASIFQATLAVPGRVIPDHPAIEEAVLVGEERFEEIGCAHCHVPTLPLVDRGWIFSEPNPYNPPGNLQPGEVPDLEVDLNRKDLPGPRLKERGGVVQVPAFTDLKLHDISSGPDGAGVEPLDMTRGGTPDFFAGNGRFLTKKLWGMANEPPFFHHGLFTTIREAVLAHAGEALEARRAFEALSEYEQDSIIEFLKTLQILPPGARSLTVNEHGRPKRWPPADRKSRGPRGR